jgi:Tol biopolymer transport system component
MYTVAPNGSGLRQLTNVDSSHAATNPAWSPDGSRIIFTLVRSNTPDDQARIWVMRADGTNAHQLSHDQAGFRDYTGTFTPDGRRIVFARCQPNDGVCAIWRMRADGSHMRAITPFRVGRNEAVDFQPEVSARGAILFTRFFWRGIASQTWVIPPGGGPGRPVTPARLEAGAADWAPSGRTIDFGSNTQRLNSSLYQVRRDGAHLRRLTTTRYPHSDFRPTFSPDGTHIAFTSDRRYPDLCCFDLFAANADGTHLHRIPTSPLNGILDPAWGPNPGGAGSAQNVPRLIPSQRRSPMRLPALCRFEGTPEPYC